MVMPDFGAFEDSAFFGKFTNKIVHLLLKKVLDPEQILIQRDPLVMSDDSGHNIYADFAIDNFGFLEVTTTKPESKKRRKLLYLSTKGMTWLVARSNLVQHWQKEIELDFKYDTLGRPENAASFNLKVVNLEQLIDELRSRLKVSGATYEQAKRCLQEPLLMRDLAQPLIEEWLDMFVLQ